MKNKIIASILIIAGFWGIVFLMGNSTHRNHTCVNVYVDFESLNNQSKITQCVPEADGVIATDVIRSAGINLTGTDKYGDKIVCRVNGLPDATREKCASMPPENAYWAVLVKRQASIADPFPKWGWAQTGISDVYLNPGDSIGLVFAEGGKVNWPK